MHGVLTPVFNCRELFNVTIENTVPGTGSYLLATFLTSFNILSHLPLLLSILPTHPLGLLANISVHQKNYLESLVIQLSANSQSLTMLKLIVIMCH